ncbi:MAG: SIMPL domain-containing protein [Chloroflexota bacterium]
MRSSVDTQRSRRVLGLAAFVGAVLITTAAFGPGVVVAQTQSDASTNVRTISVTATGRTEVVPDIARIGIGVTARGSDANEASSRAARRMQAIIDALVGAGVTEEDIQTSRLGLGAIRRRSERGAPSRIVGWQVRNRVTATIRDIGSTGDVVDAAIEAGATDLGAIAFRKDDPSEAEAEARMAAVTKAASIAQQLAAAAGVEIAGVHSIAEGDKRDVTRLERAQAFRASAATAGPTPVLEGTIPVSVTVFIEYDIG